MSFKVSWPIPLERLRSWYPGQLGVPGADNREGIKSDVNGAVFYVDPNHPDATTTADGTYPDNPLSTVAAALLRCRAYHGDTIAVMANHAWGYGYPIGGVPPSRPLPVSEEVVVNTAGVRIVGLDLSGNGVVWTPASNGGICITVNALDVLIEGFMFGQGTFAGCTAIKAIWDGNTKFGDNVTVRNCMFDPSVDTGIELVFSWYSTIYNNIFSECDAYGIIATGGNSSDYLDIHDNIFHDVITSAMSLINADDCHIYQNSIYCATAKAGAASTNKGINTTGGAHNQVELNTFSCLLPTGVPASGDYDDLNSAAATDAWIANGCLNGTTVTNPT